MKTTLIKKQTIRKLLAFIGFGSSAFIFAACYGSLPKNYENEIDSTRVYLEEYDSLSTDSVAVEVTDPVQ
jgi:hypothetical protein